MRRRNSITFALLVVPAALLLAACGGGDELTKSEYEKEVRSVMVEVRDSDVFSGGQPKSSDLQKGSDVIETAASDLAEIEPPADVKELHGDLVAGIREFGDQLGRMAPILARVEKDPKAGAAAGAELQAVAKDFSGTTEDLEKTINALEDKGYDTGAGAPADS
ncbi:MAG: hypothetical protein JWM25_1088 [Thermoleophilia bacterium]|nr:hypothetical protein [Thermoleophilia bacterium]MCZ4496505.1 hypothetical protein [Thermoleophilia bacterium]